MAETMTKAYDALNRLTLIDYPTGQVDVTFSYDPVGKRLTMNDQTGTTTYSYDGLYRLATHTNGAGETVTYAYDKVGNRLQLSHAGQTVTYSYDPSNRLLTVDNESGEYGYGYDDANRLTSLSFPNGVQSNYDYDAAGRMIGLTHTKAGETLASYQYQLDNVGNRLAVTESLLVPASSLASLNVPDSSFVSEPMFVVEQANAAADNAVVSAEPAALGTTFYQNPLEGAAETNDLADKDKDATAEPLTSSLETSPAASNSPESDWFTAVQALVRRSEYNLRKDDEGAVAANRAHNLRSAFSAAQIMLESRQGAEWQVAMQLVGFDTPSPTVTGNRIEYQRDGLVEWYVNDETGLEQGFTLNSPLPEAKLELALDADEIATQFDADQKTIKLASSAGTWLNFHAPVAIDAKGEAVPSQLELVKDDSTGKQSILLSLDDSNAVYPITLATKLTSPDWQVNGSQNNENFGFVVSGAGDVNNDGYDDVIVGAPDYDSGRVASAGRVLLYLGSRNGLSTSSSWQATGSQSGERFGAAISTAGDMNGNRFDEIIIGAPGYDSTRYGTDTGKAYLYTWASRGMNLAWSAEGEQKNAQFGYSVANAGNVNNDNYDDLLIGAPQHASKGRVYLHRGQSDLSRLSITQTLNGSQTNARFGAALGTAGYVNADNYADIVIGAPDYDSGYRDRGRVYVYHGSSRNLTYRWTRYGSRSYERFGSAVSTAGDVNGDGYDDLLVGAPYYNLSYSNQGRLYVYLGRSSGLSTSIHWKAEARQSNARLGYSVANAGDLNHDGYDDIIVGVPYYSNRGRALVYHGSSSGLNANGSRPLGLPSNADLYAEGSAGDTLGGSVRAAGDVNGDNFADIIIGAPTAAVSRNRPGKAYVYHGNDSPIAGLTATNNSPTPLGQATQFSASVSAGTNVQYSWNFGDGTTGTGANPSHTYAQPGSYTAVVTAYNNANSLSKSTQVTIKKVSVN